MATAKQDKEVLEGVTIDESEIEEAKAELAKSNPAYFVYRFESPWEWEGKKYDELHFNFGKLTGKDSIAIMDELSNRVIVMPQFSEPYLVRMCAKACEEPIGSDALMALPIHTYNRIIVAGKSFLNLYQ